MSYQFPPDLDQRVKAQITSFGMPNEDEVLRAALDALEQLERDKLQRWQAGNEVAIEQSRRGLSKPLDIEALFDRVETRVSQHFQGK
jgi:Arc/MetJ-type ribon-helix-helix transcriptional regulator